MEGTCTLRSLIERVPVVQRVDTTKHIEGYEPEALNKNSLRQQFERKMGKIASLIAFLLFFFMHVINQ